MKKRKCSWCYFDNGGKKKITSWYRYEGCIVFYVKDECYMFKNVPFYLDDYFEYDLLGTVKPHRKVHSYFYKFRFKHPSEKPLMPAYTLSNDYWIVAPIDRIEVIV
jgi:hypothetical protein